MSVTLPCCFSTTFIWVLKQSLTSLEFYCSAYTPQHLLNSTICVYNIISKYTCKKSSRLGLCLMMFALHIFYSCSSICLPVLFVLVWHHMYFSLPYLNCPCGFIICWLFALFHFSVVCTHSLLVPSYLVSWCFLLFSIFFFVFSTSLIDHEWMAL